MGTEGTVIDLGESGGDAFEEGILALRMRDWSLAESYFRQAMQDPTTLELELKLAQVEIELHKLQKAEIRLLKLARTELAESFSTECTGLLGRTAKQRFMYWPVDMRPDHLDDLDKAIRYYGAAYRDNPGSYWVGGNEAVLRRLREDYSGKKEDGLAELVAGIRKAIGDQSDYWAKSTTALLCVLEGDIAAAVELLTLTEDDERTTAFEVGGNYRTMEEISQSPQRGEEMAPVLDLLAAQLASMPGPDVELQVATRGALLAPCLQNRGRTPHFVSDRSSVAVILERLLPPTCRVEGPGRDGFASALLVTPRTILTNHHVFPDHELAAASTVRFGLTQAASPGSFAVKLAPQDGFATGGDNFTGDWTLVRLAERVDEVEPITPRLARVPEVNLHEEVIVVHYPMNAPERISYRHSFVASFPECERRQGMVRYTSATEKGSSGAPVFNLHGQFVALHHAGTSARYEHGHLTLKLNEGVLWSTIVQQLVDRPEARSLLEDQP